MPNFCKNPACNHQILHPNINPEDGTIVMDSNDPKAQMINGDLYVECPSCKRKNGLSTFVENGVEVTKITHLLEE